MRGAQCSAGCRFVPVRISPAYAGSTTTPSAVRLCPWDHPRVCGEHRLVTESQVVARGSSPRMRGALLSGSLGSVRLGIIPAYAGSTSGQHPVDGRDRDHPRVCGEHRVFWVMQGSRLGSSPRMRGARGARVLHLRLRRIIPAYAGSTQAA